MNNHIYNTLTSPQWHSCVPCYTITYIPQCNVMTTHSKTLAQYVLNFPQVNCHKEDDYKVYHVVRTLQLTFALVTMRARVGVCTYHWLFRGSLLCAILNSLSLSSKSHVLRVVSAYTKLKHLLVVDKIPVEYSWSIEVWILLLCPGTQIDMVHEDGWTDHCSVVCKGYAHL